MMQSPDHPELRFVQAAGYTRGRPDGPPLWIVVHDMEAQESGTTAEATAAYFANGAGGRSVSAHYCVDNNSVVQCVRLRDSAWTVGNRPGNNRGINWELAGFARQTRAQWLDAFGLAMFHRAAPIIRADAARYGISLRRCTVTDLRALRPGVTSHNDLRLAFGVTDHTDPGPNFPWDTFLEILRGKNDVNLTDRVPWFSQKQRARMVAAGYPAEGLAVATLLTYTFEGATRDDFDADELAAVAAAAEAGAAAGVRGSVDELVAAVVAKLPAGALTKDDVEDALRQVLLAGVGTDG
jgi:N-acetyl-anhydromuramyl-L-alanine amidase AmpD